MSGEPQLFRVNADNRESVRIEEVDFAELGFRERQDIQEWVAANPDILGEDLLIIGKEFSGFDRTNERLDLLAVDADGKLVIIELKRDDTGADAHWQAIKYASYLHRASIDDILRILGEYDHSSPEDAATKLSQHIAGGDLAILNNDQRIVLASHRFAPEVTSAALWLNEKAPGNDLITCVKLTPYRDANTDSLYLQATTIIPVPDVEQYVISVGGQPLVRSVRQTDGRNELGRFVRTVNSLAWRELEADLRTDWYQEMSRPRGKDTLRSWHFWHRNEPWAAGQLCYTLQFQPLGDSSTWNATVGFLDQGCTFIPQLAFTEIPGNPYFREDRIEWAIGSDTLNGDFAARIAETLRNLIVQITPLVNKLADEDDLAADDDVREF